MRIMLVYPSDDLSSIKNSNQDKTMAKYFGQYPHLGLAIIAACLERAGHDVKFLDGNALNMGYKQIEDEIKKFNPGILCFSATTLNFPNIIEFIKHIKKSVVCPIIVGGPHFTYYPKESLSYKEVDFVVIGDGVETIVELADMLENKKKGFDKIKGLGYRNKNKVVITPPARKIIKLDEIPWPARHLLPKNKYFSFLTRKMNSTVFYTEYGCPGRCIFCDRGIGREMYRTRSAENVFEEIKDCYNKLGIREILFYDASFTTNKGKIVKLCKLIVKSGLKIEWSCSARADMVDYDLLKLMKDAGCRRIQYGIETANPSQLVLIKKSETREQIEKAIKWTRKVGISPLGFFMLGLPGDDEHTMEDNVKYALSLDIDYVSFSLTRSFPNTEMYERQMKEMGYDYWALYTLGKIDKNKKLGLYGTKLSIDRVQEKVKEAYLRFYFRPSQIWRILKDTTSILQIRRYIAAAFHFGFRVVVSSLSKGLRFISSSQL